jgi:hypothetical protein
MVIGGGTSGVNAARMFLHPDNFLTMGSNGVTSRTAFLSTRPEKAVGLPERWDQATASLRSALEAEGIKPEARAETVPVEAFAKAAARLE